MFQKQLKTHDMTSGNISIRVPVNLRGIFPTVTDRNFVQGFSLCYPTEHMNHLPDTLDVAGATVKDEIHLIIVEGTKNHSFIDALCEVLKTREIPYTLSDRPPIAPRFEYINTELLRSAGDFAKK